MAEAMVKMIPDHLPRTVNPGEVALGTQGDHTAARRAPITPHPQCSDKSVEIALDIAMTPDPPVAATGATFRAGPGEVAPMLMNLLEIDRNSP